MAAAIHVGDLRQAEDAARTIEHPDQQPLALIAVSDALAAAGDTQHAIDVASTITNADRRADALSEVARLAAGRGEFSLAEHAARAVTVRGGQSPALLSVAWEATRASDLDRAARIVASIGDQPWRTLGLYAINAQRYASPAAPRQFRTSPTAQQGLVVESAAANPEQPTQDLLSGVDAAPDDPSAAGLLAEAMRSGPCTHALASLSRVDPLAAVTTADILVELLK